MADPFLAAIWDLHDREKAERRGRSSTDDGFPSATGVVPYDEPEPITYPAGFAAGALRDVEAELRKLVHGQRNTGLNNQALRLGHLVGGGLLDHDETAEWLLALVGELWPDRDAGNVRSTVFNGLRDGAAKPLSWELKDPGPPSTPADPFGTGLVAAPATSVVQAGVDQAAWMPLDLRPYLDGTYRPVLPSMLRRTDGAPALYRGRVHWLSGEPESLKTWLALLACAQCLLDGEHVTYVDLEDSPHGMVERLRALGLSAEVIHERFHYISPDGPLTPEARSSIETTVRSSSLLVIDAATEALSRQGLTPKDDVDIAKWLEMLPRWAVKLGPAVLVLDHVVKDTENRGRWATGSQHKLAGLDGAAFLVEPVIPGGRGKQGKSRVYIAKDRHGHLSPSVVMLSGARRWFADLIVDDTNGLFLEVILQPSDKEEGGFSPTIIMGKISDLLAEKGGRELTAQEIADRLSTRPATIRQALAALIDDEHVVIVYGERNSKKHKLLRPYPPTSGAIDEAA